MEVEEALKRRKSVRRFLQKEISEEQIKKLLEAGFASPSACNKSPWIFYVITNKETLNKLKTASRFSPYDAPLAICVIGDMNKTLPGKNKDYWLEDCSAATENILLEAVSLGLGAVWCGGYPQEDVCQNLTNILSLPSNEVALNIIYIGYPQNESLPKERFDENLVRYVK